MILLQAVIAAGALALIFIALFMLIGTPVTAGILMKLIWRIQNKKDYIKNNMSYYEDPVRYVPCLIISAFITAYIAVQLLLYFGKSLEF